MVPRRLRTLEAVLVSGTTEERMAAIEELGRSRNPYALDLLYPIANCGDVSIAGLAQQSFEQFTVAHSKVALRHASTFVRHEAAVVLGQRSVVAAVEELSRVIRNDSDEALRLVCVQALGAIGQPSCVFGLRLALKDAALKVRQAAFEALRGIGGPAVEAAVADLLADHDWDLRMKAQSLLQSTGWFPVTRAQKALWGIVNGRFDDVVCLAPEAIEPLLAATLQVNDASVRKWSATALARVGSADARRRLRGALASPDPAIRTAAAEALRAFGDTQAAPAIELAAVPTPNAKRRQESTTNAFQTATWLLALMGQP